MAHERYPDLSTPQIQIENPWQRCRLNLPSGATQLPLDTILTLWLLAELHSPGPTLHACHGLHDAHGERAQPARQVGKCRARILLCPPTSAANFTNPEALILTILVKA